MRELKGDISSNLCYKSWWRHKKTFRVSSIPHKNSKELLWSIWWLSPGDNSHLNGWKQPWNSFWLFLNHNAPFSSSELFSVGLLADRTEPGGLVLHLKKQQRPQFSQTLLILHLLVKGKDWRNLYSQLVVSKESEQLRKQKNVFSLQIRETCKKKKVKTSRSSEVQHLLCSCRQNQTSRFWRSRVSLNEDHQLD